MHIAAGGCPGIRSHLGLGSQCGQPLCLVSGTALMLGHLQGTEVDHIVNLAQGGSESLDNLQLLCAWHHKRKTALEASANRPRLTERHPGERHPGFIGD